MDAFRSRHWVLTTCGCPPCPGFQSPPRIVVFDRQSLPKPLPRLHPGGDNPNMKLKTLVEKPGGYLRLATEIKRSSIYNIDVCPLFQLDAVWPTQMQHKTKKNSKTSHKRYHISFLYLSLATTKAHQKAHQKYASTRNLQGEKKKSSPPSWPFGKPK